MKMKTHVLIGIRQEGVEWLASAYRSESAFCSVRALSEPAAVERLRAEVEGIIAVDGRAWLERWKHAGSPRAPNCPEGTIKLPIDLWTCKLVDKMCPIQSQVLLDDRAVFLQHCLAPRERSEQIFDTVTKGKYDGSHHIPGRYLCVWCQRQRKSTSRQYHYPWELTCIEAYYPFVFERDWPRFHRKLRDVGASRSEVSNALCAAHCTQLAEQLDPALAATLRVIEFEVSQ